MGVIADLIRAGVDPELVEKVHNELIEAARSSAPLHAPALTARQARNARYYQTKKGERLKASETSETSESVLEASETSETSESVLEASESVLNGDLKTGDEGGAYNRACAPAFPVGFSNENPPLNPSSLRSEGVRGGTLRDDPPKTDPAETAPRKAKRAKSRSEIAEDAQPTENYRASAEKAGLDAERFRVEWRKFRDYHRAKGSLMADWSAAWRTWLGNVQEFQRPRARAGPAQRHDEPTMASIFGQIIEAETSRRKGLSDGPEHTDFIDDLGNDLPARLPGPPASR